MRRGDGRRDGDRAARSRRTGTISSSSSSRSGRAEAHAGGGELLGTGPNQIPSPLLPYGLRTVNGKFNNLIPGQEEFGMADRIFPRLVAPLFRDG